MGENLNIAVRCQRSFLFPDYAGQDLSDCEVIDLSRDALIMPGSSGSSSVSPHQLILTHEFASNETNATQGWKIEVAPNVISIFGGQTVPFTVTAKATPQVTRQDVAFNVHVDYTGPNGYQRRVTVPFLAEVNRYDFATVSVTQKTQSQRAGQDDIVRFEVVVQNVGVYPDSYSFSVKTDDDIQVTPPPNLYVPPGETRTVVVQVLTPQGKLYEIGRSVPINIKVASNTGTGVYGAVGILQVRGAYLPTYWVPLLLLGLVSMGVIVRGSREKAQLRSAERGRPRRVELTPRQTVLLAELKRSDPVAYREKKRSLDSVYKERVVDYRGHRKENLAKDQAEARQARLEFLAAKKARKARRAEEKREAKRQRAEAKRQAKLDKKAAKREGKLVKKKEKALAKVRAKLEKKQAKEAAKQAKLDARQAKLDAKRAQAEARAAKKAEKDARKKG